MGRNVIISIDGDNVTDDGERRNVSIITHGVYDRFGGVHTLRYTESDEESGQSIETTILVEGERVVVTDDANATQMMFQCGRRFSSAVQEDETDEPVELGVFPTRVSIDMNEEHGTLNLAYQMDVDGVVVGDNSIRLCYRSCDV